MIELNDEQKLAFEGIVNGKQLTLVNGKPGTGKSFLMGGIKKYYEEFHKTNITEEAIDTAIKLSVKYQADKKLPDKAIDLIDCACSRFNLKGSSEKIVGEDEIQFEIAKAVNLPEEQVKEKETSNLANLEKNLKGEIYGQDKAIDKLVRAIKRARSIALMPYVERGID